MIADGSGVQGTPEQRGGDPHKLGNITSVLHRCLFRITQCVQAAKAVLCAAALSRCRFWQAISICRQRRREIVSAICFAGWVSLSASKANWYAACRIMSTLRLLRDFSLSSTCKTSRKNSRVLTGFFVAVCESLFKNLQCMLVYDSETKATARFAFLPRVGA